jgi:hypothetical protein
MPKSTKEPRKKSLPTEETQRLYARAYGSRLAKEVNEELDSSRRKTTPRKKPRPPGGM